MLSRVTGCCDGNVSESQRSVRSLQPCPSCPPHCPPSGGGHFISKGAEEQREEVSPRSVRVRARFRTWVGLLLPDPDLTQPQYRWSSLGPLGLGLSQTASTGGSLLSGSPVVFPAPGEHPPSSRSMVLRPFTFHLWCDRTGTRSLTRSDGFKFQVCSLSAG